MPEVICEKSRGGECCSAQNEVYEGGGEVARFVPGLLAGINVALLSVISALLKMETMYGQLLVRQVAAQKKCGDMLKMFHEKQGSDLWWISFCQGIAGIVGGGVTAGTAGWAMRRTPPTQHLDEKIKNVNEYRAALKGTRGVVVGDRPPAAAPRENAPHLEEEEVVAGAGDQPQAAAPEENAPPLEEEGIVAGAGDQPQAAARGGENAPPLGEGRRRMRMPNNEGADYYEVSEDLITERLRTLQQEEGHFLNNGNRLTNGGIFGGEAGDGLAQANDTHLFATLHPTERADLSNSFNDRLKSFTKERSMVIRMHSEKSNTCMTLSNTISTLCNGGSGLGSSFGQNNQKVHEGQTAVSQSSLNLSQSVSSQYHGNIDKRANESSAVVQTISAIGNANMVGQV